MRVLAFVLVSLSVLVLAATTCWYATWPPLVAPGDALGTVLTREGRLPRGAAVRRDDSSMDLRVFGIADAEGQQRVADAAREVLRRFDKSGGHTIEFWSGPAPPEETSPWDDPEARGAVLLRSIRIDR